MRTRTIQRVKRGFTLIEILIVVVILGILAAIVIPQFAESADSAQANAAHSTLQTIRSQFELCKFKNDCDCDDSMSDILTTLVDEGYLQSSPVDGSNNVADGYALEFGNCRFTIDGQDW